MPVVSQNATKFILSSAWGIPNVSPKAIKYTSVLANGISVIQKFPLDMVEVIAS